MAKHKRLRPIGDYLYDKGEMIEQMFSSIPIVEIRNMVPMKLQGMPLHELKAECLVELLGISDREILNILDGKKEKNVSSSDSEQGGFVISDEEGKVSGKKIKKEKKDTVRRIKTERVLSKKDGTSRSSEPSTSKKKRKSKELVEVNSKKKKLGDKTADIPSSSKTTAVVPVSKKKKAKKDEKKKDSLKKKEEDDEIVVLDDDSDKEEKQGQKSLLDLLELEMRARAIRSLLKKEEAVQAQKFLSEYKDEPDDLIPIDIEPPQIELLSDSEGEETTNGIDLEAHENKSVEKMNDDISSKHPEDSLQCLEDREQYSRSPQGGPTDDSNSVSFATEKMVAYHSRSKILNENTSKSPNEIGDLPSKNDLSDPSPVETRDGEKNDEIGIIKEGTDHDDMIKSNVPVDVISFIPGEKEGELCVSLRSSSALKHFDSEAEGTTDAMVLEAHESTSTEKKNQDISKQPDASSCKPDGNDCTEQDTGNIEISHSPKKSKCTLPSAENLGNKIDAGHFLVIEEPSIVQAMDGSQIKETTIEANYSSTKDMKPSIKLDIHQDENTCRIENVGCLTVQEEFQQPTLAQSSLIDSNCDPSNEKNEVANFIEPSPEKVHNCDVHMEGVSDCSNTSGANLHTPKERCESTDQSLVEGDSHSQFEDEVLDYDYIPNDSYCDEVRIAPSGKSPNCVAVKIMGKSTGDLSGLYPNSNYAKTSEEKQNNLEDSAHQVSIDCGIAKPETNSCPDFPENCDTNLVDPLDLHREETAPNTCSLGICEDCTLENYETSELKKEVRPSNFTSPESVKDFQPETLVSVSTIETKPNKSIQGIDGSNDEGSSLVEMDPQNSLENIYKHGEERLRCLRIKPPVDVEIQEREESPEQNQMTTEQELTLQTPGFSSGSSENVATIITVSDLPLLEDDISNVGKVEIPQNSVFLKPNTAVPASVAALAQQTSLSYSERVEKTMISDPCSPIRTEDDSELGISNVSSKQAKEISVNCNESHNLSGENIEDCQNPECSLLVSNVTVSVKSPNSISSQILEPLMLSKDLEILDEANDVLVCNTSGINANTHGSDEAQHPCSQDLVNDNVAEVIDITEHEPDDSEVLFVSEEIVDSDSVDLSDNEASANAALILEQMNNILNDGVCIEGESTRDGSCQPSPQGTNIVIAEVCAVNSKESSEPATDEENEDDGLPGDNTVVEVSDLDDDSEEETKDEGTSDSVSSGSESSHDSIEVIDDSGSVESQRDSVDDSKSDDCVIVPQPQGSISEDCFIVKKPVILQNNDTVVLTDPEFSESEDCALKSQHRDATLDEIVHISDEEGPCVDATGSLSSGNHFTPKDKDSVMVTIIIEDDDGEEEEVKLLTEDVPAEILELDDDDEAKTNWTARWLESDNVKKVVQTSKILTNVRKQMKMKLKKIEAPVPNELKLSEVKSAPALIGSVEEYHRLVKEGVIFSKATQNKEKPQSSNNAIRDSVDPSKESTDTVSAESTGQEGRENKSDKETTGKKKKSDRSEKTKKSKKSERRRKSDRYEKKKSDELSLHSSKLSQSPGAKRNDTYSNSNENLECVGKVVSEDAVQEDGEIIESPNSAPNPKERNGANGKMMGNVFDGLVCLPEQNTGKDAKVEEREEGETSGKEEGEISDSDDDGKESQKSSQLERSSSLKTTSESKGCSRSVSPLSSIPLPQKPPPKRLTTLKHTNHLKQQSSKTPDRNSAAKRFIIRNLQLGRNKPANSKNKKKKKKKKGVGQGNKKGLGYSPNVAFEKNKRSAKAQMTGTCKNPTSQTEVGMASTINLYQTVPGVQPSYMGTYSGLSQPGSNMSQLGSAQGTTATASNSTQMYDSYYSWAYSQGLISPASSNYGYGTPETIPDPNVYKQWEEYYRKLMEACKVSAEHASASSLYTSSAPTAEKSGYSWVFDHSSGASQTAQVQQTVADSTTEPVPQVQAPSISSETGEVSQSVPVISGISDKERFESWQYRYGLKGVLKEHFIPAPTAPSSGDGSQKS